ncbi:hypothetical protein [Lacticaseibacillus salsurivasis]|uniref:hypothetical protein n=1 Tax=Lacticaseibacillus salsurivasis TaxID=3081441 RepID=UPI0030C6D148
MVHGILGLSWAEWLAVLGIVGAVYGGIRSLLKNFGDKIAKPLSQQIAGLTQAIDDLTANSLREHNTFDKRLDRHDIKLGIHDAEIGTLYSEVGLRRKEQNDD